MTSVSGKGLCVQEPVHRSSGTRVARVLLCGLALVLTGCSTLSGLSTRPDSTAPLPVREGRLFLRVDTAPPTVTQADIRLEGTAEAGQLTLFGPLGTTQGQLRWSPGEAVWSRGLEEQRYGSLDQLLAQSLGTTLPVPTVLAWMDGQAVTLEGWELVSLPSSQAPLVARRRHPSPTLELRLRLNPDAR